MDTLNVTPVDDIACSLGAITEAYTKYCFDSYDVVNHQSFELQE